jgi:uncharacterized protein (TIGR03066 family)
MRLLSASLAAVITATLVAFAAPVPKEKTTAEKLVGTWKLVKFQGEDPPGGGATVEFTKDGKMIITFDNNGEKLVAKGTYKVVGDDKIDYKVTLPGGEDKSEVLTIKKLTEDELVTTDPDDLKEEFKRVKEEKKKEEKK